MTILLWIFAACCIAQMIIIRNAIKVIDQWKDLAEQLEKEANEWRALAEDAVEHLEDEEHHDLHGAN